MLHISFSPSTAPCPHSTAGSSSKHHQPSCPPHTGQERASRSGLGWTPSFPDACCKIPLTQPCPVTLPPQPRFVTHKTGVHASSVPSMDLDTQFSHQPISLWAGGAPFSSTPQFKSPCGARNLSQTSTHMHLGLLLTKSKADMPLAEAWASAGTGWLGGSTSGRTLSAGSPGGEAVEEPAQSRWREPPGSNYSELHGLRRHLK